MEIKPKKKKVKGCLIVIGVFFGLALLGSIFGGGNTNKNTSTKKNEEPKKVEEVINIDNENPTSDKFKKAFNDAKIEYNADKKELTIIHKPSSEWSDTSLAKSFARQGAYDLDKIHKNPYIDKVLIIRQVEMIDKKGNQSVENALAAEFSKNNYKDINFDNWIDQIIANAGVFYNVADGYVIAPGIYAKIDPELKKEIEK